MRIRVSNTDHPNYAEALNRLGIAVQAQGKYGEAEGLHERAFANCSSFCASYRQRAREEPLRLRVLALASISLGANHRDVGQTLTIWRSCITPRASTARRRGCTSARWRSERRRSVRTTPTWARPSTTWPIVYWTQGKYSEAEGLFKRALVIREKALGANHADVGQTLNNLAGVYRAQGKYSEAEGLFKRALAIREKALGANHPAVADTLNRLADVYRAQRKYAEAEGLFKRALVIREKALGANHPDVAETLHHLAILYEARGKHESGGAAQCALVFAEGNRCRPCPSNRRIDGYSTDRGGRRPSGTGAPVTFSAMLPI